MHISICGAPFTLYSYSLLLLATFSRCFYYTTLSVFFLWLLTLTTELFIGTPIKLTRCYIVPELDLPIRLVELNAERLNQTLAVIQCDSGKEILLELGEGHQLLGFIVGLHVDTGHQMLVHAHLAHLVRRGIHVAGLYLRYDGQSMCPIAGRTGASSGRQCRMPLQMHRGAVGVRVAVAAGGAAAIGGR